MAFDGLTGGAENYREAGNVDANRSNSKKPTAVDGAVVSPDRDVNEKSIHP